MGGVRKWLRDDVIAAYALYCITPLNKINPSNKIIQQVAEARELSLASLVMRMRNFQYIDPAISGEGKKGLGHVAKLDKEIFEEFRNDWGELSIYAEEVTGLAIFDADPEQGARPISSLTEKNKVSRERHFFRASVFAAYNNKCCITGLELPTLLVASHIKPYSECRGSAERTDPHNGLLLNTFYDKAFDQGLITVTKDYTIYVSKLVKEYSYNEFTRQWLIGLEGNQIIRSKTFLPDPECLEYHNDIIFKG